MQMPRPRHWLVSLVILLSFTFSAIAKDRVTILYDAFSDSKEVTKDWGFSALVEHDGKRILFDTGNDAGDPRTQCQSPRG